MMTAENGEDMLDKDDSFEDLFDAFQTFNKDISNRVLNSKEFNLTKC